MRTMALPTALCRAGGRGAPVYMTKAPARSMGHLTSSAPEVRDVIELLRLNYDRVKPRSPGD
jgi:hypothetical protein